MQAFTLGYRAYRANFPLYPKSPELPTGKFLWLPGNVLMFPQGKTATIAAR
jgi:hypothetical protein